MFDVATVALLGTISGAILGWMGHSKSIKADAVREATSDATLKTDVSYIKNGIMDLRVDLGRIGSRVEDFSERLIRLEEISRQYHSRLDKVEKALETKGDKKHG